MSYEFDKEDASVISSAGLYAIIIAALMALGGVIVVFSAFLDPALSTLQTNISLGQGLIQVVSGLLFIPAALAFRRVATTEGKDVGELLNGTNKMSTAFYIITLLIVLSVVLDVVQILGV